jgi:hypothetical protein
MDLGLFHLMEDFILNEVDSQEIQKSSRAKRRMKRNLNKELAPYLNEESDTHTFDDDSYEESYESPRKKYKHDIQSNFIERHMNICLGIAYTCVLFTFYGTTIYLIHTYSKCNE